MGESENPLRFEGGVAARHEMSPFLSSARTGWLVRMSRSVLIDFREALFLHQCASRQSIRMLRDLLDNPPVRANPKNGAVSLMARPPLLKNGGDSEAHDPIF